MRIVQLLEAFQHVVTCACENCMALDAPATFFMIIVSCVAVFFRVVMHFRVLYVKIVHLQVVIDVGSASWRIGRLEADENVCKIIYLGQGGWLLQAGWV